MGYKIYRISWTVKTLHAWRAGNVRSWQIDQAVEKIGIDIPFKIVIGSVGTITPNILRPEKTAQSILHALLSLTGCAVCIHLYWLIDCSTYNVQSPLTIEVSRDPKTCS